MSQNIAKVVKSLKKLLVQTFFGINGATWEENGKIPFKRQISLKLDLSLGRRPKRRFQLWRRTRNDHNSQGLNFVSKYSRFQNYSSKKFCFFRKKIHFPNISYSRRALSLLLTEQWNTSFQASSDFVYFRLALIEKTFCPCFVLTSWVFLAFAWSMKYFISTVKWFRLFSSRFYFLIWIEKQKFVQISKDQ